MVIFEAKIGRFRSQTPKGKKFTIKRLLGPERLRDGVTRERLAKVLPQCHTLSDRPEKAELTNL